MESEKIELKYRLQDTTSKLNHVQSENEQLSTDLSSVSATLEKIQHTLETYETTKKEREQYKLLYEECKLESKQIFSENNRLRLKLADEEALRFTTEKDKEKTESYFQTLNNTIEKLRAELVYVKSQLGDSLMRSRNR